MLLVSQERYRPPLSIDTKKVPEALYLTSQWCTMTSETQKHGCQNSPASMRLWKLEHQKSVHKETTWQVAPDKDSTKSGTAYKTFVVAPYVQGVSQKVRWVFSSYGVSICFKPHQTLCQILVAPKDRTKAEDQTGVVYRIPGCNKVCVGELRDQLESILKNILQKLPTTSLQWQNITKRQDMSQIWTTSRSCAGRINCCLVKYVRLYS